MEVNMKECSKFLWAGLLLISAVALAFPQGLNVNVNGGFEGSSPAFWNMGNTGGATLSWATDQHRSGLRSIKIAKTTTGDSASWISDNMCDIWSPTHTKNVDIFLGAWVRTSGVNTAPATESAKWYLSFEFYDTLGVKMGTFKLPIPQATASTGAFVADTCHPGDVILPKDSYKTIIKFVAGKDATGTVWVDDFMFYGRAGQWAGQDWGTNLEYPTGFYYWMPPIGGNDGVLDSGFENTVVSSDAAHSGLHSLKFDMPFTRASHDGFVAAKRAYFKDIAPGLKAGDVIRITAWLKASNLVPDSAALYPGTWSVGLTPLWFAKAGNNDGYDVITSSDYTWQFPSVTSFDWTPYTLDIVVPAGANALEVRTHIYARFTGTIYWDDLKVEKLDVPTITQVGGFEGTLPAYWNMGNIGGATLSWATDQHRSGLRSIKIVKTTTGDSASWISDNMCDIWSPTHTKNVDIFLGAYVRTQGVNTAPATESAKWYLSYEFYDTLGVKMGTFKLPIPQATASTGAFVADTCLPGDVILPKDSYKTIIKFVAGKDATGTVWVDDFMFYGRAGQWAGQDWGTNLEYPTGFYYWMPPIGGNDGVLDSGFENTVVSSDAAHSGLHSLKYDMPFARASHDGFVAAKRVLFTGAPATRVTTNRAMDISELSGVNEGDVLRITVWLKASNLVPDSAALYPGTWSVGFTPLWFAKVGNNDGYDVISSSDYTWQFPPVTSFDWTPYTLDVTVPAGAKALEVRTHVYARFTGTIYWDDMTVEKLDVPKIADAGGFEGTLPAYWNMGNNGGGTLSWATDQHRSGLRSIKIQKTTTGDSASWISDNMCDIWSPTHTKNVDIFLGAYVRTQGVNTAPATESAKWYLSYEFYDTLGVLMGTFKLPIPQATASTGAFVADTCRPGDVILPKDSYKTIIKFVAGKDATGTVWADDFMFYGRGGQWAGQDWGTNLEYPSGWYYWMPPIGGNDGVLDSGFENTVVTTEAAHSGLRSLKYDMPFTRASHDGFVAMKRVPLGTEIKEGDILRLSAWLKGSSLVPDSAALYPGTWSVGFTPLWFAKGGNNDGYDVITSSDYTWQFPAVTAFNWTPYTLDVTVPAGAKFLEVRSHIYARFTGTIYWDDISLEKIGSLTAVNGQDGLPHVFELGDNYPNPFNPTTTIQFGIPQAGTASIVIYNVLGQKVRTLTSDYRAAGRYTITWDGKDDAGHAVGTGMYLYRLQSQQNALVKKMMLVK
jgi:hypothetical protein